MPNESAEQALHRRFGLSPQHIERIIHRALGRRRKQGAFGEIYFEDGCTQMLTWDQGVLTSTSNHISRGASVRAVLGDKFGFSYTDNPTVANLLKAASQAEEIME